ncbi:MAG: hypothetical protein PHH60_04040 [Candidatus Margulisbacteria bacterium]|nr:hypothetical protein [Candidatus Margulisiibacteriota bacterium]
MGLNTVFWRPVNLFRSKETRAMSPHTSNWGLAKIFYRSQDNTVKAAVINNLAQRINSGELPVAEASRLPLDLIKKAVAASPYNIKWLMECLKEGTEELRNMAQGFNSNNLELLTGLPEKDILEIVGKGLLPTDTIKKAILHKAYNIELLRHCLMFGTDEIISMAEDVIRNTLFLPVQRALIDRLGQDLTSKKVTEKHIGSETRQIWESHDPQTGGNCPDLMGEEVIHHYENVFYVREKALATLHKLSGIVSNSLKPLIVEIFAKDISDLTPKTRKVIDQPAKGHYEERGSGLSGMDLYSEGGYSLDPSASVFQGGTSSGEVWIVDVQETSHQEYSEADLQPALALLKPQKTNTQDAILAKLAELNPPLANLLAHYRDSR